MATKRIIPLNRISGVNAGGTATIDLPTDVRYHRIWAGYKTDTAGGATQANMEKELKEFRFNIDGVTQKAVSMAQHFKMNKKNKIDPVADGVQGYASFHFSERHRNTKISQEATAWGMLGVGRFQIEIDIDDTAVSPRIEAWAEVDDVQEAPMGIVKHKKESIQVASSGELVYKLDTEKGDSYQGLYFFETADGDISRIKLEWDGVKMRDTSRQAYNAEINDIEGLVKVDGMLYIPLDRGNPEDALPSVKLVNGQRRKVSEFLATLTMANANNLILIREMVGSPD